MVTANHSRGLLKSVPLDRLQSADIDAVAAAMDGLAAQSSCREDAASRIVELIFKSFTMPKSDEPACALARCFQTHSFSQLPAGRRAFAARAMGSMQRRDDVRCLSLLATRGILPQWNRVEDSQGHQAIPLPTVEVILRAPMIARLLVEMGIKFEHVVAPPGKSSALMIENDAEGFNIFHIEKAFGSPHIPAQASFIQPYSVRSVLGLGGLLPGGEVFAVILFSRVPITRATAELFRPVNATIQRALMGFPSAQTFFGPADHNATIS